MRQLRTFLVVAGLLIAAAAPASAAPPSTDHTTNARAAAAWLGSQLSANGTVETAPGAVNYSLTIQALIALETAGVGGALVDKGLAFVGSTVEAYVHAGTTDDPGALAYVIIAVVLRGQDPTSFGTGATDLVQRLKATERGAADPDAGLFGASAPDFDGAYRQGLALLALHASGATASATAIAWLEDQQCGNGLWLAFRADTALPCPPADPGTFSGPDTNSTALGALGLSAQGRSASALEGVDALLAVRTSTGGWGFVAAASVTSDANSDAVVLQAIKAVKGQADAAGLADLEAFQLGCDAPTTDRGAIQALDFATSLPAPNVFATVQSVPALAGAGTYAGAATIDSALPEACAPPAVAPGPTDNVSTVDVAVDVAVDDPTAGVARDEPLARTGSPDAPLAALGSALIGAGGVLLVAARRRRHATLLT